MTNATVRLLRWDAQIDSDLEIAAAMTAADGGFEFQRVEFGDYVLIVEDGGPSRSVPAGGFAAPDQIKEPDRRWGSARLRVDREIVEPIQVTARIRAKIRGALEFEGATPIPSLDAVRRIPLVVSSSDGRVISGITAAVGSDRHFETSGLPPGRYFVRPPRGAQPSGWIVSRVVVGGRESLDQPIEVLHSDVAGVRIVLSDKSTEIRGVVRDLVGRIDLEATVLAYPSGQERWTDVGRVPLRFATGRPNQSGEYLIRGLPAGEYFVVAVKDEAAQDWQVKQRLEQWTPFATRLLIALGDAKSVDLKTVASTVR